MDFKLDEQQQQLKDMIGRLSAEQFAPRAGQTAELGMFPKENIALLAKQGLMGLLLPPPFGGAGSDTYGYLITVEALGRACASTAFVYATHVAASFPVLAMGTDAQKRKFLEGAASGRSLFAFAANEAGGGTNPMAMQAAAAPLEGGWVLNGRKAFISSAGEADVYLVFAYTDKSKGPAGMSAFLVERGQLGLSFGRHEDKMGMRASPAGDVILEDCRLSADAMLGPPGGGMAVLGLCGGLGALGAGAMALGLAAESLDRTKAQLVERTVAGQKLGSLGGVQLRFADMHNKVRACRATLYAAAHEQMTRSPEMVPAVLGAKIFVTETALEVIDSAIQLHGCNGYSREYPFERFYRDARALTIHFGNSDAMRANLSLMVLGLMPR